MCFKKSKPRVLNFVVAEKKAKVLVGIFIEILSNEMSDIELLRSM